MTFVQAAISRNWVVLASDRRITRFKWDGHQNRPVHFEDSATKSVIVDQRYVMGFAGLGTVRGQPMEEWIGEAIFDSPRRQVMFDAIGEKIEKTLEDVNYVGKHSFVAVGFFVPPGASEYASEMFVLSNHLSNDRDVFLPYTQFPFEMRGIRYVMGDDTEEQDRAYIRIGGRPDRAFDDRTRDQLGRLPAGDNPDYIFKVLVDAQREAAETSEGTIGRSTLITWIPKTAVPLSAIPPNESEYTGPDYLKNHEYSIFIPDPEGAGSGSTSHYRPARYSRSIHFQGFVFEMGDEPLP